MDQWDVMAERALPAQVHLDQDFVMVQVNPEERAREALLLWLEEQSLPKEERTAPRPADIYRKWAKRLREQDTPEARDILRQLMLQSTVPFNELETPDFVDGYTGQVLTKEEVDDEWVGREDTKDLPHIPVNEWQEYLVTHVRQAYADPDDAAKAMAASSEWVGSEDEEYVLEDRGFEPEYAESVFTTDNLPLLQQEIRAVSEGMRKRIRAEVEKGDGAQDRVRSSPDAEFFIQCMNDFAKRGEEPQDIFVLMRPFIHGYAFQDEDLKKVKIKGTRSSLYEWAVDFEDLVNSTEEAGPLEHFSIGQQELEEIADRFLGELVATIPVEGDRTPFAPKLNGILRSRHYVEGFIRAQINGAENPANEAWRYWRRKTSPMGALAYDDTLQRTGSLKAAMTAFWRTATREGDHLPPPKRVTAVKPTGLRLDDGREISWATAAHIACDEGFEDQERLANILTERGWGKGIVSLLK